MTGPPDEGGPGTLHDAEPDPEPPTATATEARQYGDSNAVGGPGGGNGDGPPHADPNDVPPGVDPWKWRFYAYGVRPDPRGNGHGGADGHATVPPGWNADPDDPRPAPRVTGSIRPPGSPSAWARAVFDGEAGKVATAAVGTRNDTLNKSGVRLYRVALAGCFEQNAVTEALTEAASRAGLGDSEIRGTLRSALRKALECGPADDVPEERAPEVIEVAPGELGSAASHSGAPGDDGGEATTWDPVELGPWLRGEVTQPTPTVGIVRSDGLRVVYPGKEHAFLGETEAGKTWLALGCVAAELLAGNTVVYIHYEEGDPGSTVERLRLLGVSPETMSAGLRFVAPARPARIGWVAALLDPSPTLVVHDGINEAMSLIGADIMAADGASQFRRLLVAPFLRVGAASIACDHLPKEREGRARDAYGSVHKGNALDGARLLLDNVKPFGRNMRGVSHVFVTKDRPGHLRAHGRPSDQPGKTYIGTLAVDDMTEGPDFTMRLFAPKDEGDLADAAKTVVSSAELADIVHGVIVALPEATVASARMLYAEMRKAGQAFRDGSIRQVVDDLIVTGRLIVVPGKRGANGYRAITTAAQEEPQ